MEYIAQPNADSPAPTRGSNIFFASIGASRNIATVVSTLLSQTP
jgi:hypothetical protein